MTEPEKGGLSRRDVLKGTLVLGVLGLAGIARALHVNISFPSMNADAAGSQPAPRLGADLSSQPNKPLAETVRQNGIKELGLPENWPQTAEVAASMFGGNKEYWRKDLYVDQASGEVKWDTWVMDAFALKTDFKADGAYVDGNGQPLRENEIYDFGNNVDRVNVGFGQYADSFKAHGTSWDGKMYKAGYGHAVFKDAVQAVIRPINAVCLPEKVEGYFKGLARALTAEEFSKYLAEDPNADSLVAGLWIEDKSQFKLVQGKGWSD